MHASLSLYIYIADPGLLWHSDNELAMKRRTSFNPKRRFKVSPPAREQLDRLVDMIGCGGNPEHKRNPGDFGLNPPTQPRADKTLCDLACVFTRQQALNLLRGG